MTILEQMLEDTKSVATRAIYARTATAWAPHWDFITISGLIIQIYGQPCIWRSHLLNSVI